METGTYLQVAIGTQPPGNLLAGHNRLFFRHFVELQSYTRNNKTHHILLCVNTVFANYLRK